MGRTLRGMLAIGLGCLAAHGAAHASAGKVRAADSDSLIVKEIADSLGVAPSAVRTQWENGRVTRLTLYYQGQHGAVPAALAGLDSLRYIFMSITRVTSLPAGIGRLKNLDTLDISSSWIGPGLPESLGDIAGLRVLKVSYCKLEALPASLTRLRNLQSVDFRNNAICKVPDSLKAFLLAINPNALSGQNTSGCVTLGSLRQTVPRREAADQPQLGLRVGRHREYRGAYANRLVVSAAGRRI